MKNAHVLLAFSSLLLIGLILGCTSNSNDDLDVIPNDPFEEPGPNEVMDTAPIYFDISGFNPPAAIVGNHYNFSFCDIPYNEDSNPVVLPSDICQPNYIPSGGNAPYHFQLESGTGFPPTGLTLHPNGLIDGTPSATGTSTFSICAVDNSGTQKCSETSIKVEDFKATFESVSCRKTSEASPYTIFELVAKGTVRGGDSLVYSDSVVGNTGSEGDILEYSDLKSEDSSCGSWEIASTSSCSNTNDDTATTQWTLIYNVVAESSSFEMTALVYVSERQDSMWGDLMTTPIIKTVTCS